MRNEGSEGVYRKSFNSLRAGNTFQTRSGDDDGVLRNVSFQFPSSGKYLPNPNRQRTHERQVLKFQFPSSGKYLPNLSVTSVRKTREKKVSIPFEREIPSKPVVLSNRSVRLNSFNSLRAGNTFQTLNPVPHFQFLYVSIPFEREIPSKLTSPNRTVAGTIRFNSLRAGNTFQTFRYD